MKLVSPKLVQRNLFDTASYIRYFSFCVKSGFCVLFKNQSHTGQAFQHYDPCRSQTHKLIGLDSQLDILLG